MKKHVLLMSIMALFIFSCDSAESELQTPKDISLTSQFLQNTNLVDNGIMSRKANSKNENSNGVIVVEGGGAFSNFIGFFAFPYLVFVYDLNEDGSPEPMVDVKIFNDDKAQFTANINRPIVEISNLITGEIVYSNICDDKKIGHLQVNWIASYDVLDFGFGPMYFANPEGATTTNNLQLSAKVNDSFVLTNPETGEGDCNEATSTRNIKLTSVDRINNNQDLGRIFKIVGLD